MDSKLTQVAANPGPGDLNPLGSEHTAGGRLRPIESDPCAGDL